MMTTLIRYDPDHIIQKHAKPGGALSPQIHPI